MAWIFSRMFFFGWYHPLNEQFDPENHPWLEEGMVFQPLFGRVCLSWMDGRFLGRN